MQRFLTGDAQLRQQPAYGHHAQDNLESGLDDLGHHLARPQRKFKFELQGILLRYRFVNPFQFLVVQLWWTTKKRFRLQAAPPPLAITPHPPKHRTIGYTQRPRYNRRSLARLDAANRPFPQSFQRLVIQSARVVFSHAATESEPINLVKENMHLLTFRLIAPVRPRSWAILGIRSRWSERSPTSSRCLRRCCFRPVGPPVMASFAVSCARRIISSSTPWLTFAFRKARTLRRATFTPTAISISSTAATGSRKSAPTTPKTASWS